MADGKNKVVCIAVNGVDYSFEFKKKVTEKHEIICHSCPLDGVCSKLKDPRNLNDTISTFADFCFSMGESVDKSVTEIVNDESLDGYIPVVEDVLKYMENINNDVFQEIIKKDPYIKVNELIDKVCGEGGFDCPYYNKDHSNCTAKNGMCILKNIFKV